MYNELSKLLSTGDKNTLAELIEYCCEEMSPEEKQNLALFAGNIRDEVYGARVFFRGLIEVSNYCKNDCYYCGIRKGNKNAVRYRLDENQILNSCKLGHQMGFRTFVLQGGEDAHFTDERLCSIIYKIKNEFSDSAVTLSLGERSFDSYKKLFGAGADRYLLRHETANSEHYNKLHPPQLSFENRKKCLYDLRKIGFQVGAGFMVDSPYQTYKTLADDFIFLRELAPHMIGIGPFIAHKDTRFANFENKSSDKTVVILSLVRILLPKALIPATTALNSIDTKGREKGLKAGANVLMPNLTPAVYRENYSLYDNKLSVGLESAQSIEILKNHIAKLGLVADFSRGDHKDINFI